MAAATIGLVIGYTACLVAVLAADAPPLGKAALAAGVTMFFGFFVLLMGKVRQWVGVAAAQRALLKTGEAAPARILELRETGITLNEQPVADVVLEVRPTVGTPFQATVRHLVPRLQLGSIVPGAEVWVRFDPAGHARVAIGGGPDEGVAAGGGAVPGPVEADALCTEIQAGNDAIGKTGVASRAVIRTFVPLGVAVNGPNPLARVDVVVTPDDRPAFEATMRGCFAQASIPKYQPGCVVWVKFDPRDPGRVAPDHS